MSNETDEIKFLYLNGERDLLQQPCGGYSRVPPSEKEIYKTFSFSNYFFSFLYFLKKHEKY